MQTINEHITRKSNNLSLAALELDAGLSTGVDVKPEQAIAVYGQHAEVLAAQNKLVCAVTEALKLDVYLKHTLGFNHPESLACRDLAASLLFRMGEHKEAIELTDSVADGWRSLNDLDGWAGAKFAIMLHYHETGQPKLAWQVFAQNIKDFDKTYLPGSVLFISSIVEVAQSLGKHKVETTLQNWLALAEDAEWEPVCELQQQAKQEFDEYRCQVGGLAGLLEFELMRTN